MTREVTLATVLFLIVLVAGAIYFGRNTRTTRIRFGVFFEREQIQGEEDKDD